MKKIFLLSLCLFAFVFFLCGCEKTIIKGENGADGVNGVDGKDGKDGVDGAKGQDAKDVTLSVDDSLGIMWQYVGDKDWKVLISFDDLINYNKKYSIKLNTEVGKINASDIDKLNDLKYNTEVTLPTPQTDEYTFLGWYDSNDVLYEGKIKVTENLELTAKWCIQSYLIGAEGAVLPPIVSITDDSGNQLSDSEIANNIKIKFLTEYCIACNYDEIKTAEVLAYKGAELYEEMKICFTPGNAFYSFEDNTVTLTEFAKDWTWILEYLKTRFVRHSQVKVNDVEAWTYVGRTDPRTSWFITFLTEGVKEAGNGSYGELAAILDDTGTITKHPINFMAMHFTNFFEADDSQYAPGTSVDKVIPFRIDDNDYRYAYNDKSRNETTYYVYSGLIDAICPSLSTDLMFDIHEEYTLPTLTKEGYTFDGWFLDMEYKTPITKLTKAQNGALIFAKFTEEETN